MSDDQLEDSLESARLLDSFSWSLGTATWSPTLIVKMRELSLAAGITSKGAQSAEEVMRCTRILV